MNNKLNIAFLSDYPFSVSFGGKEIQMLQYLEFISKFSENEIKINLLNYWDLNELKNIDILHLFGYSNWYSGITKILKVKYPDLKIVVSPTFFTENPSIYKFLSRIFSKFKIPNYFSYKRSLFNLVDSIICNSKSEKQQLESIFHIKNSNLIKVLPNSIEKDFINFKNEDNKEIFIKKYEIEPDYFLSVSFLDKRKNSLKLIQAFLSVFSKINKKLVLIGEERFTDSKDKKFVKDLLNSNKDKILHIHFLERNSDILKSAYLNCHAHLLPSHFETPGISSLEAAAFGKPILVGACKPVREYFQDFAHYVNPNSLDDISNKIIEISKERDEIQKIKTEKLIEKINKEFIIEEVCVNLVKLYKSII